MCKDPRVVERVPSFYSLPVLRVLIISRKIFGGSTGTDEGSPEPPVRDTLGPSMRERMDNERRERMQAIADN